MLPQRGKVASWKYCLVAGVLLLLLIAENVACGQDSDVLQRNFTSSTARSSSLTWQDVCTQLPDGAYPDYTQACRMFFICSGGQKAATFWCTKGYVFSLAAGHCEPPGRALCPDPKTPSILDDVFQPHVVATSDKCIQGDGVYPDFSDGCSSFFICKGGIQTTFKCPGTSVFDWKTKSCRTSSNLFCHALICEDKEDGTYIDTHNYCKRYFECHAGNITEYICPDGTIFNARHHRCTRSSTTRCRGLETARCAGIPDGYYPDFAAGCKVFGLCMNGGLKTFNCPANTIFDSKTLTCETDAHCPKPDTNKCLKKLNGIHPDYDSGCKDFFMCLDGLLTHQGSCPQGKLLNPENGNCQPSSLVSCFPTVDADCNKLSDGVYPDYNMGCSAYFICLNHKKVSTSFCPGTDLYDIATGRCLPSSFVICREYSSFISPPRLFDTYNCDNRLGIFPEFSSDCQRFVTCAYGHVKTHDCPEGTYFDHMSNKCQKNKINCDAPFAVASFQCLPGDDGVYVSPNCSEWHECRNGIGFTNVCPQGMQYHIQDGKCVATSDECSTYMIERRIFLSMTVTPTETIDPDFNCPSKEVGVYADPISSPKFHFCVDGKSISYFCPANFSYEKKYQRCVFQKIPQASENRQSNRLDNRQMSFTCDQLENGMYADLNADCRRYFVCENGNAIPVYCPDRQRFNSVKMICDKEELVRCLTPRSYVTDTPQKKQLRQNDDIYHVYKPEELYTETYSYVPSRNQAVTKHPDLKSRVWDEYDNSDFEKESPHPRDDQDGSDSSRAQNSIHNESANKRHYSSKYSPSQIPTISMKSSESTTISYNEQNSNLKSNENQTVKIYQVRATNRDFEAACRKGGTGFFPDYESGCKMFHICFRTIRKTYSCPSVLIFNPETKHCDLPENVLCIRPEPMLETSFDCRKKRNHFVPDYETGCKNYIGCINNLPYRFTCPQSKFFNPTTSVCDTETVEMCRYFEDSNTTNYKTGEDSTERSPSLRHVHGIPGQFYFTCNDKRDGFYPDYTRHCHVFYRCVRGKKFSHYCKQGLLFNPESGICDFEENVKCSSNNRTTLSS